MAIRSFSDDATEVFFLTGRVKNVGWSGIKAVARRKLDMLHYAAELLDLRSPPGNRLEALKGDLKGWYSIRINDQWRIVFRWSEGGAEDVRIENYH